jgi:hypothetical protein
MTQIPRIKEEKFVSKEPTPQFIAGVQLISALVGLTLAMQQKFGTEVIPIAQTFAEHLGTCVGAHIKQQANITGTSIHDIERLYHAWLDPALAPQTLQTTVTKNTLTVTRKTPAKCTGLVVAQQMNLPLETICRTISQPLFTGVAKAINPNAIYTTVEMSQAKCEETITLP